MNNRLNLDRTVSKYYMDTRTYQKRLRELLTFIDQSKWLHLEDINDTDICFGMDIPDLVPIRIRIVFKVEVVEGVIMVSPILKSPHIMHPNICRDDYSICIASPEDDDDIEWDRSLTLLLWGVASLLVEPNFDDPLCNSTATDSYDHLLVKNADEYARQFNVKANQRSK